MPTFAIHKRKYMGRQKKDFIFRTEFNKWLKENKITSATQYFKTSDGDKFDGNYYYDIIASFLLVNEPSYAYSFYEKWYKETIDRDKSQSTYLKRYKEFLSTFVVPKIKSKELTARKYPTILQEQDLAKMRNHFRKKTELAKFDGMEGLIFELGEDRIIKMALEQSFFFHKDIIQSRYEEMDKIFNDRTNEPQYARKSQKNGSSQHAAEGKHIEDEKDGWRYEDEFELTQFEWPIKRDTGNAQVCSIINNKTGYNLNVNLEDKPFRNYIISHIWGRAIDPRYYTSLWNIVLVPAWVNHLLDKDSTPDSLESRLKATFMEICKKMYNLNSQKKEHQKSWVNWRFPEEFPEVCDNPFKNNYTIQVINLLKEEEESNQKVGAITYESITVT